MAITYTSDNVDRAHGSGFFDITSGSLSIAVDDIILALWAVEDNTNVGVVSISNSGTALTWNLIAQTNTGSNCKVSAWWAISAHNENRTVTVNHTLDNTKATKLCCHVLTGAHLTNPVPPGNVFSGTGATDVSQSITPTASGSALWMAAADWAATNTFAAIANCTLDSTTHAGGFYTATVIRPTTQPRTDANAFTIGETDTAGTIAWIAFEVQAAPDAAHTPAIAWITA